MRNFRFFSPYLYSIEMIKMNVARPLKTFMCIKKIEYTIVCNTSDKEPLTEWISWLHILTYGTQICLITKVPAARDCLAYFCIHKITLAWRCHPILACNKEFYWPSLSLSSWVPREGVPRWRTYNEEWAWLFKLDWTFWYGWTLWYGTAIATQGFWNRDTSIEGPLQLRNLLAATKKH